MKLQYKNFRGKTYFVRQSLTKTGKVKYICSTRESDSDLTIMPDGMEFYEKASGLVGIRKKLVSRITDAEYQFIQKECRRLAAPTWLRFELSEDAVSVYSSKNLDVSMFGIMPLRCSREEANELLASAASFMPSLRFSLADEKKREFAVERMCFMGDQDEWYFLECGKLEKLVKKYSPHIEKESMFDFL